ncbi:MAG: hypothetical protein M3179_00260 [Actinomycetota bacterium]|nr:hypothetical protein [Actinomycetota bacterium]
MTPRPAADEDPVRARRARAQRLGEMGQRIGYGCLAVAIVAFVVGAVVGFSSSSVAVVVTALVVGSLVLAPGIIIGYGVKAAEREDRRSGA